MYRNHFSMHLHTFIFKLRLFPTQTFGSSEFNLRHTLCYYIQKSCTCLILYFHTIKIDSSVWVLMFSTITKTYFILTKIISYKHVILRRTKRLRYRDLLWCSICVQLTTIYTWYIKMASVRKSKRQWRQSRQRYWQTLSGVGLQFARVWQLIWRRRSKCKVSWALHGVECRQGRGC